MTKTFNEAVKTVMARIGNRHQLRSCRCEEDHFYETVIKDELGPLFDKQAEEIERLKGHLIDIGQCCSVIEKDDEFKWIKAKIQTALAEKPGSGAGKPGP